MVSFKYDATGVQIMDFSPVPPGNYHVVIAGTESRLTSNGYPMEAVTLLIDEGPRKGQRIWHNVTFMPKEKNGAGIAIHFLKTIGESWEGEIEVNPDNWVGKRFLAKIGIREYNGKELNQVTEILPVTDGVAFKDMASEVPF